jgi:hypothetical protein
MAEWLYKATDGEPRPDYESTRAFAVEDGILCRSAKKVNDTWIGNVQHVKAGHILHLFFKQRSGEPAVHLIGSFRVRDPGATRLNDECDLALVQDAGLEQRLRAAYEIAPEEQVTGWLLEPARDVRAPSPEEPEVAKFLEQQPSLVKYHGSAPASDVLPKDRILASVTAQLPTMPAPLRLIHGPLLVTIETWSDGGTVARFPAARLYGEGHDDASAMEALCARIAEFVETHLLHAYAGKLGGTLAKQWSALTAMVDVSAVRVPMEDRREVG